MKDSDARVRSYAAYALGQIKPTDPAIQQKIRDAGYTVDWKTIRGVMISKVFH